MWVNLWPGPVVNPLQWPNNSQPTTNEGMQQAMLDNAPFAFALFLTVAEPTVFLEYIWWYPVTDGVTVCPDDPSSCMAPPQWYPDVDRVVGAPKGKAVRAGNTFTRSFENVDVYLDLDEPLKSKLSWH